MHLKELKRRVRMEDNKVLMMYSGGRDSMLSVCRLVDKGFYVHIGTCANGHIHCIENARNSAEILKSRYPEKIQIDPILDMTPVMYDYLEQVVHLKELGFEMSQCICLCCRFAMLVTEVIWCKNININRIATGDRSIDPYLFRKYEFKQRTVEICKTYGIEFLQPVYDVDTDHERNVSLAKYGFFPKVLEPKCWIGFSPYYIDDHDVHKAVELFDNRLLPKITKDIEGGLKNEESNDFTKDDGCLR